MNEQDFSLFRPSPNRRLTVLRSSLAAATVTALVGGPMLLGLASPTSAMPASAPTNYSQTSAGAFSQTVPDGVCSVNVTVAGGHGGAAAFDAYDADPDPNDPNPGSQGSGSGSPGAGAVIKATLKVAPGQVLAGQVGGNGADGGSGGFGGGGAGGAGVHSGGGGGGYSAVKIGSDTLLLAGGGGGTGGGHTVSVGGGGTAGSNPASGVAVSGGTAYPGETGQSGSDNDTFSQPGQSAEGFPAGGAAGGATAGGAGGVHYAKSPADDGSAGSSLQGGAGAGPDGADQGGGGGGGFFGGGGGATTNGDVSFVPTVGPNAGKTQGIVGGGGGGGSSFVASNAAIVGGTFNLAANTTPGATPADPVKVASGFVEFDWVPCVYDLKAVKSVVGPAVFEAGTPVTYEVTITNNGPDDMPLGDKVTIKDSYLTGAKLVAVSGDLNKAGVNVGDTVAADTLDMWREVPDPANPNATLVRGLKVGQHVTVRYAVTPTGTSPIVNTVTTFDTSPNQANNAASATIQPAAPKLTLKKTASPTRITAAGQKVTYTFTVKNAGNIRVDHIAIKEGSFSGTGKLHKPVCKATSLEPTKSTTCAATYVATKADVVARKITNTATATGLTPGGNPVVSAPDRALVHALPVPVPPALPDTGAPKGLIAELVAGLLAILLGAGMTIRYRKVRD